MNNLKYEYGVEYETNGEKPELPDDVLVRVMFDGGWMGPEVVDAWVWGELQKFRIVDERYKMADHIADVSNMVDNDWYKRGELPPVGSHVDVVGEVQYGAGEEDCEVVAHVENCAVIRISYGLGCFASHVLRPTRSERDKVIEAAGNVWQMSKSKCTHESFCTLIVDLYDAGWRPIKQQTEDEFTTQARRELTDHFGANQIARLYRAGCRFVEVSDE